MRKVIKISLLVFLGIFIGLIAFEVIMLIRVSHLQSTNPAWRRTHGGPGLEK